MNKVDLIACSAPFCQSAHGKQKTNLSIDLRITVIALGIIAIIVTVLINVPSLLYLRNVVGRVTSSMRALVGTSINRRAEDQQPPKDQQSKKIPKQMELPTSYYTYTPAKQELVLRFWKKNSLDQDKRPSKKEDSLEHRYPVAASPSHGMAHFEVDANAWQNIIFDDGRSVTHIDLRRQDEATFMKPNVDTMLVCCGIHQLLEEGIKFKQAIDIGAGSGFIAKYLAINHPSSQVTAIDIDPCAAKYMNSKQADMPKNIQIMQGDAIPHLSQYGNGYDLIVSNPPYVPSKEETQSDKEIDVKEKSFWEGTGMIAHMLEKTLPQMPPEGHLIVVIPSTSLKSKRLAKIFQEYSPKYQARVLYQQEVAYRAWFAGNNKVEHLLATDQEKDVPTHFRGVNLKLFVGITKPGEPRDCRVEDGRRQSKEYYWQMVYIIDFRKSG